jgi:hypothetical protein
MDSRRRWRVGPALRIALGLALGLWATGPAGAGPTFDGQGRIIAVDPGRSTVTIEHGGIPGLLPAAQSEFPVQGVVQGVRPGDRVRFTLGAMDESHGLLTVLSLTPESAAGAGWLDRLLVSAAAPLALPTPPRSRQWRPALARDPQPPAPDGRARSRGRDARGSRRRHPGRGAPDRPGAGRSRHGPPRGLRPAAPAAATPRLLADHDRDSRATRRPARPARSSSSSGGGATSTTPSRVGQRDPVSP